MRPMKTIIKKVDKNQIDEDVIQEAGEILKRGGLVAFPRRQSMDWEQMHWMRRQQKKLMQQKGVRQTIR